MKVFYMHRSRPAELLAELSAVAQKRDESQALMLAAGRDYNLLVKQHEALEALARSQAAGEGRPQKFVAVQFDQRRNKMNDKLDAIANAAMAAVSALDTAANGDLTGVPQNIQDALNKWQNDNEAHAAGTVTAFADAVRALKV